MKSTLLQASRKEWMERFTLTPFWVRIRTPGHEFVNADTNKKTMDALVPVQGQFVGSDHEEDFIRCGGSRCRGF
jgi:hypothetical protein